MSTPVLGNFNFSETPTVNGSPLLVGDGNTPSVLQGPIASIPAAGEVGRVFISTDTNLIYRDTGVTWVQLAAATGSMRCLASAPIPAATGTSLIPLDNTAPRITEGTQIWSQVINCSQIGSNLIINNNMLCDSGSNTRNVIAAFFLDSTCIGVSSVRVASAGGPMLLASSFNIASTALTHTVSCRVGISSAATWYINRQATAYFNGLFAAQSYSIMEY